MNCLLGHGQNARGLPVARKTLSKIKKQRQKKGKGGIVLEIKHETPRRGSENADPRKGRED